MWLREWLRDTNERACSGLTAGPLGIRARLNRGQRGESLVEMLLTIFLMGTVLVSLLGLLATVVLGTLHHRGVISAGNQATTVAEMIDVMPYKPCGQAAPNDPQSVYSNGLSAQVSGFSVPQVSVEYLNSNTSNSPLYVASCPGGDKGTQLVTVRVKMLGPMSSSAEVKIVKRNRTCPGGLGAQIEPGQEC